MGLCFEWGIPHSEFLRWSQDDRDKATAFAIYKAGVCPRCGTRPEDWWEVSIDQETGEETRLPAEPPPYIATTVACLGCQAIEEESGMIPSNRKPIVTPVLKRRNPKEKWTWQMRK